MKSVEGLDVFKLAHRLALRTYSVTKNFPKGETFSLVDQMRRAAISVGMNLIEGAMRLGTKEYRQFVGIARPTARLSGEGVIFFCAFFMGPVPRSLLFYPNCHRQSMRRQADDTISRN